MLSNLRASFGLLAGKLPRHLKIAIGVVAALFVLSVVGVINLREKSAYDFRLKHRPPEKAHRDIVLLEIDDKSLQALGPWPWRRNVHADLLKILHSSNVSAVFFDILFPEKSQFSEDDQAFAQALHDAGNVILPFHFLSGNPPTLLFPIPEFLKGAKATGYANTEPDSDGVVRSIQPYQTFNGKRYFHSSIATMLSLFSDEKQGLGWAEKEIVQRYPERMLVNYPGKIEVFQRMSVGEVFERAQTPEGQEYLKSYFNGKIVLYGDTATGSTDISTTPLQPMMPGLAIQASVVSQLKKSKYLSEFGTGWNWALVFVLAWVVSWVGQRLRPHWAFVATVTAMVLYAVVNFACFYYGRFILFLPTPIVAMFTVFILSLFFKYMDVRIESDFLERELGMASKIQQSILPANEFKSPQIDASFRCLFYQQVGGDLYDWVDLGDGRVTLCLGDVSGKGVPAALYMSRAINELRHQVISSTNPGEILTQLNHHLAQGETSGMFLTLFFLIVDFHSKKIRFANAGHDPMVFFRKQTGKAELVTEASGLPIGIMDDQTFETGELAFEAGDILLLTSDGIKEQKSPTGEIYGSERLQRSVEKSVQKVSASEVIDTVMADVLQFSEGRSHHDDRTLVCAKIL